MDLIRVLRRTNNQSIFNEIDRDILYQFIFYTDDMIWINKGKPKKKFAILLEPKTLQRKKYNLILNNLDIVKEYDALFT